MPRSRPIDPVVEELRARLEAVDRSLVLGLRARERLQQELFAFKRTAGLALYDLEQERLVQRRARSWAEEYGADPDLVEDIIDRAVQSGKRRFLTASLEPRALEDPVVVFLPGPEPRRPRERGQAHPAPMAVAPSTR